MWAGNMKLWL